MEKFVHGKGDQALERAAKESGEFTNFRDIKEMCGHGNKGYGLVVDLVVRLIAGLDDLKGLLQPK